MALAVGDGTRLLDSPNLASDFMQHPTGKYLPAD